MIQCNHSWLLFNRMVLSHNNKEAIHARCVLYTLGNRPLNLLLLLVITGRGSPNPAVWTRHPAQTHPLKHGKDRLHTRCTLKGQHGAWRRERTMHNGLVSNTEQSEQKCTTPNSLPAIAGISVSLHSTLGQCFVR